MIDRAALILQVAARDGQLDIALADGCEQPQGVALQRIDAVGIKCQRALDAATRELIAQEVKLHALVDWSDNVHVDGAATADAVDDAHTGLSVAFVFLHATHAVSLVAGPAHNDASRPHQLQQRLALELALAREGQALAATEVDDTGQAIGRCAVKDVLEAQHGSGRGHLVGVLKLVACGVEVGHIDVALGSHAGILALHGRACHSAHHMGAMRA